MEVMVVEVMLIGAYRSVGIGLLHWRVLAVSVDTEGQSREITVVQVWYRECSRVSVGWVPERREESCLRTSREES